MRRLVGLLVAHATFVAAAALTLQEALKSHRDLWGKMAMQQPDGPSYEFFAGLLPPLRYVNAAFRHYPITLSAPFSSLHARLVSNGSALNARAKLGTWREVGFPVVFHVGEDDGVFGDDLRQLDGPRYDEGWLPIVELRYRHGNALYEMETFVGVEAPFAESAAVFVRLGVGEGDAGRVAAEIAFDKPLTVVDGFVRDEQGNVLAWAGTGWRWDAARHRLSVALSRGRPAHLVIFTRPGKTASAPPNYDQQRARCLELWSRLMKRGTRVEVAEPLVNNAWRSLVLGTFLLCRGDRLCYSAGNAYERQYEAECGDAVRALLLFGFRDEVRRMLAPLLDYKQKGLASHDAAFKLQLLAHYFWLTRDAEFVRQQRDRWQREADFIVQSREPESGLLPRENYCGDIHTQVYSLNSNANAWRGLRDIAAVLDTIGEREAAQRLAQTAQTFRCAILAAVDKSERRDVQPPFIPVALFGEEKPYETLTASQLGGYWCLMAPYLIGSGVFGDMGERTGWLLDYLHQRGGVCMGMIRFDQHSKLFANENGLDDLYGLRYVTALLRRDEVDRALVSFYGKLAHGLTRDTFIGAEGTSLVPLDEFGRPMYLPPNATSNALLLWTLRYLLVQDWDTDDDGRPDTLRVLFATPRRWLEDGATLRIDRAPTTFGEVSVIVQSRLRQGEVMAEVTLPPEPPRSTLLRCRLPAGWRIVSAEVDGRKLPLATDGTAELSGLRNTVRVRFSVSRLR
jgi:hypothetical protein